jgi:hypothetical protein
MRIDNTPFRKNGDRFVRAEVYNMEYLIVHFPRSRRVRVNEEFHGRTNELIALEAGTHTVTLGPPANFTPLEQKVLLEHTSALKPCAVTFHLKNGQEP